ncbi:hypothetical protein BDZ45DRAFT_811325 [Acephala macrosclerotiorum]|nr:hypothetical protein BDZ45DRAFT_811325 [Acephala macrosclerotiorum]
MAVPPKLLNSFEKFDQYPTNLVFETDPTDELRSCGDRLARSILLDETRALVNFLDLHRSTNSELVDPDETEIKSDSNLQAYLDFGVKPIEQPPNPIPPSVTTQQVSHVQQVGQAQPATAVARVIKKDPICRFIFLHAPSSRNRLRISHRMLARAFTHHQVMSGFVDFISVFETQAEARGQRFCGFKIRSRLSSPDLTVCEVLGRSGQYYQMCYILRSAGKSNIWTIRQTVFHHQFDIKEGTALWISAKGGPEMKKMISKHTSNLKNGEFEGILKCFASTLKIHKLHSKWCIQGWLEYIESLENELDKMENELEPLMSGRAPPIIPFDRPPTTREVTLSDLRSVQSLERKSYEARMALESNANILSSLRDFYENLVENSQLSVHISNLEKWDSEQKDFARGLRNRESEIHRFETRCNRLVQLTADQRSLVIKQLEFQSSRKMERLSFETFFLGKLAQKEAVAVRIITIVSLIYLPCSVVSSIFSTDIVKFQTGTVGVYETSFSWLALQRWMEVTLPLTFLTLALGFFGYNLEKDRQDKDIEREREERMQPGDPGTSPSLA